MAELFKNKRKQKEKKHESTMRLDSKKIKKLKIKNWERYIVQILYPKESWSVYNKITEIHFKAKVISGHKEHLKMLKGPLC